MIPSLCPLCAHCRQITSGKGSRFLLCEQSFGNQRFPKYPRQPVVSCSAFHPATAAANEPDVAGNESMDDP